jgi:hypothetical protein
MTSLNVNIDSRWPINLTCHFFNHLFWLLVTLTFLILYSILEKSTKIFMITHYRGTMIYKLSGMQFGILLSFYQPSLRHFHGISFVCI